MIKSLYTSVNENVVTVVAAMHIYNVALFTMKIICNRNIYIHMKVIFMTHLEFL